MGAKHGACLLAAATAAVACCSHKEGAQKACSHAHGASRSQLSPWRQLAQHSQGKEAHIGAGSVHWAGGTADSSAIGTLSTLG